VVGSVIKASRCMRSSSRRGSGGQCACNTGGGEICN